MKAKITYWTLGDSVAEREVELASREDLQAEIDKLIDDPQEPLCQVKSVEIGTCN